MWRDIADTREFASPREQLRLGLEPMRRRGAFRERISPEGFLLQVPNLRREQDVGDLCLHLWDQGAVANRVSTQRFIFWQGHWQGH